MNNDTPLTDAALAGETDVERLRALYRVSCRLEREVTRLKRYEEEFTAAVHAIGWMQDDPIKAKLRVGQSLLTHGIPVLHAELLELRHDKALLDALGRHVEFQVHEDRFPCFAMIGPERRREIPTPLRFEIKHFVEACFNERLE